MTNKTDHDDLLAGLRRAQRTADRYRRSHGELTRELVLLRDELARCQARYREIETSMTGQIVRRVRSRADRVLPAGSWRRVLTQRALQSAYRSVRRAIAPVDGLEAAPPAPIVPMAVQPEASIVIPVHDRWELTVACLQSIAHDTTAVGFEVIVVDDASTDQTASLLPQTIGVRSVRLDDNLGFVHAVNAGIAMARGRFVVLLNNDTTVTPGWLDALVSTAESDPRIGVVGAKLIYPDGRLQEAGGIIWDDASGHNYGRDQDADDPAFNFVRDVDYCSGACLLVRHELLKILGGLDTRFSPAYYEDTDLCFAARSHGYRVVYQPSAVVRHHEGASHGTDVATGVKRHQVVNQGTFATKWGGILPSHGEPRPDRPRADSWRRPSGRALVIDHQIPMPDHDSGSRRMSELLDILGELGFGVTFVPQNGITISSYRDDLTNRGIEVLRGPQDLDEYMKGVGTELKLIVLSRPTVAWANFPMMRSVAPHAIVVYDTVDLHFIRERRRAYANDDPAATKSAQHHYGMEMSLARLTDQTWVVSDTERVLLHEEDPDINVAVVPNIHREEPPGPPYEARDGLLFVGNYAHHPNRDAAIWLAKEILSLVRQEIPEMVLMLAGSHMTEDISALAADGTVALGWVPDLTEVYNHARLFVAPLRYGAGMKGKIGESLVHGLPVVTTEVGIEGMALQDGSEVLVGDDAESLAAAIVKAYRDQTVWELLAVNGRAAVNAHLSPSRVRRDLAMTVWELGLGVTL